MKQLLKDLVGFKTVYGNYQEFDKCLEYIKNYFKNVNLFIKEYNFNNDKSLVISNYDTLDFDVIFCGHLDVVPAKEQDFYIMFDGSIAYGRGAIDMKGQVATMMKVIKELKTDKKVALMLNCDEEQGGTNGANKLINEVGYTAKVAIVPDGGKDFELIVEEKGILRVKMTASGIEAHGSQPWKGNNAILKLYEVYNKILEKYPLPKSNNDWITSFDLAKIEGGDALNKVPKSAAMYLDIRYISGDSIEEILEFLKHLDGNIEVEKLKSSSVVKTSLDDTYVKKYIKSFKDVTGKQPIFTKFPAASDARYFAENNIPAIIMNPIGDNLHCSNEYLDIESLGTLKKVYKRFIEIL